jgi:uncharacterized membrane protein YfcA
MTPILILFYGITPAVAVGTDLLYASISKAFAVTLYRRNGSVDWAIVGWLSLGSVPATLATLSALHAYGDVRALAHLIKLVLSIAIIVTATFTLFQEPLLRWIRGGRPAESSELPVRWRRALTVFAGALIGTVVTISSVGAGVIGMVILLLLYPRVAPTRIVGSDLAHAVVVTAVAGLGHAKLGTVDLNMLLALLVGALPGIWIGSRVGFRLNPVALKRGIAGLLIFVGTTTLAKAAGL